MQRFIAVKPDFDRRCSSDILLQPIGHLEQPIARGVAPTPQLHYSVAPHKPNPTKEHQTDVQALSAPSPLLPPSQPPWSSARRDATPKLKLCATLHRLLARHTATLRLPVATPLPARALCKAQWRIGLPRTLPGRLLYQALRNAAILDRVQSPGCVAKAIST